MASFMLVEFGMMTLKHDDLDLFFQTYDPSQVGNRPTFVGIDGGRSHPDVLRASV